VKRIVTYTRVSTSDQTTANQLPEVEAMAAQRGTVVSRYSETGSAAKRRPAFEAMLAAARRGEFDVLVVWAIDRFGRSLAQNVADLTELDRLGVAVVSVRETWLDTAGPTRGLLVAILSWAAEQERARLIERTRAGLSRARAEGKSIGRPTREFDLERARSMIAAGATRRDVAKELGVGVATLARGLARAA
jgi:DNA invertase Pin-like site-specific DNA recombinase